MLCNKNGNLRVLILLQRENADKSKVQPRTGKDGPEVKKRYSSTLSLTLALDGGTCSTPRRGHFTPEKDAVPIV
jgi:hypothetical protein